MDQIVNRTKSEPVGSVQASLGLGPGAQPRRRRGRTLLAGLLVLVAAAAVLGGYAWLSQPADRVSYATVPAETGNLVVEVSATGTLQPLTQVDVSSELSGIVRSVAVEENQTVTRGGVLAVLDTARLEAQIERADASAQAALARVTEARTTLVETEQTLSRAQQLKQRGMTTDQALDTATAARDRAKASVDIAQANYDIAVADLKLQQADLDKSTIYSPIDGVVLTRSVNPGQTVATSMQAPVLFVIAADLKKMELKAAVDEADIGAVVAGQKARFTVDAFPERSFDATIRDISFAATTTEGVVTYNARLDVDNGELLLRPGMTATVAVVTREAENVITVPAAAFRFNPQAAEAAGRSFSIRDLFVPRRMGPPFGQRQRSGGGSANGERTLYVLRDGAPQAVSVRTGATDGDATEIVSGLTAGDPVIVGIRTAGSGGSGARR